MESQLDVSPGSPCRAWIRRGRAPLQFNECAVYIKFVDNYATAKDAIRRSQERSPRYRQFVQVACRVRRVRPAAAA